MPLNATNSKTSKEQLLVSRKDAAHLLGGVCTRTLIRLEQAGRLTPLRLDPKPKSTVFYKMSELVALTKSIAQVAK